MSVNGEITADGVREGRDRRSNACTKRFGDVTAVDDVSFTIPGGEFFSMLGPSGCGKTTTLRMIAGFETPDEGRILLQGGDVTHVPPAKRNVNMVFQAYGLFPHMTVAENIAFGPKIKKLVAGRDRRARDRGRRESCSSRASRTDGPASSPAVSSSASRWRRALVNRPAALLLDEPLGALDLKLRKEMQLELKDLQQRTGTTFVYVTHDQEEAMTMSDRIAVMNGGVVEQLATPRELYQRPASAFVAGFIGTSNLIDAAGRPRATPACWRWTSARASGSWRPSRTVSAPPAAAPRSRCGRSGSSSRAATVGRARVARRRHRGRRRLPGVGDPADRVAADRRAAHRAPAERRGRGRRSAAGRAVTLHWAAEHSYVSAL